MNRKQKIVEALKANPDWSARQVAEYADCSMQHVYAVAKSVGCVPWVNYNLQKYMAEYAQAVRIEALRLNAVAMQVRAPRTTSKACPACMGLGELIMIGGSCSACSGSGFMAL